MLKKASASLALLTALKTGNTIMDATKSVLKVANAAQDEVLGHCKGLRYLIRLQAEGRTRNGSSEETLYYLSKAQQGSAAYFNKLVQGHQSIENQLHWHLKVTFHDER